MGDRVMSESPTFRKPDRYKSSSYRSYNFKMPKRYDSAYFIRLCQVPLWHRTILEEVEADRETADILDVGCGTGSLLADLAKAGAGSLAGVDLAPKILDVAREKLAAAGARADLRAADAEEPLPWPSESFDVATLTGALHHFYRPRDVLAEIHRLLRPGGRLLIVDPCFFTPVRQLINLYLRVLPHDGDYHFYDPSQAGLLLTASDFECSEARRVGLWAYFLRAIRPGPTRGASRTSSSDSGGSVPTARGRIA
jgi:ubiquinone/menaquinone biosynthesis C-methylase UbiE